MCQRDLGQEGQRLVELAKRLLVGVRIAAQLRRSDPKCRIPAPRAALGRERATRLTERTTADGFRSWATRAASSLRPSCRSCCTRRRRSGTNSSGASPKSLSASSSLPLLIGANAVRQVRHVVVACGLRATCEVPGPEEHLTRARQRLGNFGTALRMLESHRERPHRQPSPAA
jgi:hypothetical protein